MKRKILWMLVSFLLVAALVLGSCAEAVPGEQEEEEEPLVLDPYEEYVARLQEEEYPVPREVFEQAIEEGQLNTYDWAEWWPEEVYDNFSQEFGIKIVRDYFGSQAEMQTKFKLDPEVGYDYMHLDLRPFLVLQELGALREINDAWVPNVNKYLLEWVKEKGEFWGDPGWKYSKPYQINIMTYLYNAKYVDDPRIPSLSVLFEPDEKYKGRITLVDNMEEVMIAALIYLGYPLDTTDEGQLAEVRDLLLRLKPYIMAFDSWPVRLILEEEAYIVMNWGDQAFIFQRQLETMKGILPAEGSRIVAGSLGIGIGSPHPAAAHLWINYLFRPRVMTQIIEEAAPHMPTHKAVFERLSDELKTWPSVALSDEFLAKSQFMPPAVYSDEIIDLWTPIWLELKK